MNILQQIVGHKQIEVDRRKELIPIKKLEASIFYNSDVVSMQSYLRRPNSSGIIAEIKRGSPSAGQFRSEIDVEQLSIGYMQAGAIGLSILTDEKYFSGRNEDLMIARKYNYCPILRKDFIIDPYQVYETKSIGADCMLLIAACLTPDRCKELAVLAQNLGLEVLLEVHDVIEIDNYLSDDINIIGVNNRDLTTFSTNINRSLELLPSLPSDIPKISESGIHNSSQIDLLREKGFEGFLIGGHFMMQSDPAKACRTLIKKSNIRQYES